MRAHFSTLAVCVVLWFVSAALCSASEPNRFFSISKAKSSIKVKSFARPFVVDGMAPADPSEWRSTILSSGSGSSCTATVIGRRVVLTAAHCLRTGPTISFAILGHQYTADCSSSRSSPFDTITDYALCLTDGAVRGVKFEKVALDPAELISASRVLLTGFGCARSLDNAYLGFQIGFADVWKKPGEVAGYPNMLKVRGGASLCAGDSGGGAYVVREPSKVRRLVAINAKSDADTDGGVAVSSLSSLSTPGFIDFAKNWVCAEDRRSLAASSFPMITCTLQSVAMR